MRLTDYEFEEQFRHATALRDEGNFSAAAAIVSSTAWASASSNTIFGSIFSF